MATNLKNRLEKLEAAVPVKSANFCLVVHHENCEHDRAAAIADYVAQHGHEPEDFVNVVIISPETKQSLCGCPSKWPIERSPA